MKSNPSLKQNFYYNLSYQILLVIAPVITAPYISKTLGPDNIGVFSYTEAVTVYFVLIGVLGLSTYSQLQCSKIRDNKQAFSQRCVECIICRMITMGISILVFLAFIAINREYHVIFLIELLTLVSNFIDCTWVLQGLEDFKTITLRNVFIKILSIGAIFLLVKNENDLWKYALINCGGTLLGNILIIPTVLKEIDFLLIHRPFIIKPHLKQAISFFLPTIASVLMNSIDRIMIVRITDSEVENGFYEQAVKIESLVFLLFTSFTRTLKPRMAYLYKTKDNETLKHYLSIAYEFVLMFAFPITFGIIAVADGFVPWFFGAKFFSVIPVLKICACWILFKAMNNVMIEQYMIPCKKQNTATIIMWIGVITNTTLNCCLIKEYGAKGAATASVLSEFCIFIISILKNREMVIFNDLISKACKKIVAGIVMFISILSFMNLSDLRPSITRTVAEVSLGVIVYFFILLVLRDKSLSKILKKVIN